MKRYFLFSLLVLSLSISASAQKLIYGKPKLFVSKDEIKAYQVKFPDGTFVMKFDRDNEDAEFGRFEIGKGRSTLGKIDGSIGAASTVDNFHAFYGDLDKNNSAELIVVDFDGQSNGLGVNYFTINIFPDFQTKGFQNPIRFNTTEFGTNGTFVYDAKAKETLILVTEWGGVQIKDPKRGDGLYFTGRYFRYTNGKLKPATDKPILARRYLNSFEKERFRTDKSPLRPYSWLTSADTIKLKTDPVFDEKPLSTESGVIEKYEEVTEKYTNENNETKNIVIKQITVLLDSGQRKTVVLSKSEDYELPTDKDKIFPEEFGILPAKIVLGVSPNVVFDKFEGMNVKINSYKIDAESSTTYKLWFEK